MGLIDWAVKGQLKKLRDSDLGRTLARGFEDSGYNDGSEQSRKRAQELYLDFCEVVGGGVVPVQAEAVSFAEMSAGSRYPILFNVALQHSLSSFSRDQLLDAYLEDKAQVVELASYVDAIYPEFLKSRPRSAASVNDIRVYQAQMWVLVVSSATYLKARASNS